MITTEMIKQLREKTGAGVMECKNVLQQQDENMEKVLEVLRKKGLAIVEKKSDRIAAEGVVDAYIHGNGRIGVLLEVNIESDFAALNKEFRGFVKDIAMQIAACNPQYVSRKEIPTEIIGKVREAFKAEVLSSGKPEKIVDRIVDGRTEKFYARVCLLEQPFIKDPDKTVQQFLQERILLIGEKIIIRRFVRFEMSEGLAKKEDNLVDEVLKQVNS